MKKEMYKKTTFTWIILIICTLDILCTFFGLIYGFIMGSYSNALTNYIAIIMTIISIPIGIVYIFKLYYTKSDLFKWTHIVFGYDLFYVFVSFVLTLVNLPNAISIAVEQDPTIPITTVKTAAIIITSIGSLFEIAIILLIWIFFYRHLKKAKMNRLMKFN